MLRLRIGINKVDYRKIYCYFILFMMLYTSDSMYTYVLWEWDHFLEILTDILMLIVIKDLPKKRIKYVVIAISTIGFGMLLINFYNGIMDQELFYLAALILRIFAVSIFTAWVIERNIPILSYLVKLIVAIAFVFLVCYVWFELNIFAIDSKISRIVFEETAGYMRTMRLECYAGFYYKWDSKRMLFGYRISSMNGFWREPGVTQIFYNFALFFYWFIDAKKNHVKASIILIVSIILTMSTMGLLILVGLIGLKIMKSNKYILMYAPVLVIAALVVGEAIFMQRYANMTRSSRWLNLVAAFERWKSSPILGLGYSRNNASWYGLINYFLNWGVLGICPIVIVVKGWKQNIIAKSIREKLAFVGWWAASLLNEAAGYTMFFLMLYFLIIYGFGQRKLDALESRINPDEYETT